MYWMFFSFTLEKESEMEVKKKKKHRFAEEILWGRRWEQFKNKKKKVKVEELINEMDRNLD